MKQKPSIEDRIETISQTCTDCGICRKECAFLQQNGTPFQIAASVDPSSVHDQKIAFGCSLCGLCTAVCPSGVDPASLFQEMRSRVAGVDGVDLTPYKRLLSYERTGTSRRFSWYGLPENCTEVFFPGCSLPGTRPETTFRIYDHLKNSMPGLGIVLDCCTKPSLNMGREDYFNTMFTEMRDYLVGQGIEQVLTACPNCYNVFKQHGAPLSVKTVYESLGETPLPGQGMTDTVVAVHDPCVLRFEPHIHDAVRKLIADRGIGIAEMPHTRERTVCCGEGGAVGCVAPELSSAWTQKRKEESDHRVITYCAGCAGILNRETPADHLADLFFGPEQVLEGNANVARGPLTYVNRLRLKNRFRKAVPARVERERPVFEKSPTGRKGLIVKTFVAALICLAVLGAVNPEVQGLLNPDHLHRWIQARGILAPVVYMLVYTLAPALFLPGLPLTLLGGVLFGPFWGVIYAITGATCGACLSFLIARHAARGWIEEKLTGPRWRRLDRSVEENGWKVVAAARLIPLFPFNLLNYAFGLTRIGFFQYAATSFVCMLPACIAYIVFASSLGDLIRGRLSGSFIVGICLLALISILPILYKKMNRNNTASL